MLIGEGNQWSRPSTAGMDMHRSSGKEVCLRERGRWAVLVRREAKFGSAARKVSVVDIEGGHDCWMVGGEKVLIWVATQVQRMGWTK